MIQKPLSLLRQDYINALCETTNKSGLPAFVVVEVLNSVLQEMRKKEVLEYKQDEIIYRKALSEQNKE